MIPAVPPIHPMIVIQTGEIASHAPRSFDPSGTGEVMDAAARDGV